LSVFHGIVSVNGCRGAAGKRGGQRTGQAQRVSARIAEENAAEDQTDEQMNVDSHGHIHSEENVG
jgi:hypothetical protein